MLIFSFSFFSQVLPCKRVRVVLIAKWKKKVFFINHENNLRWKIFSSLWFLFCHTPYCLTVNLRVLLSAVIISGWQLHTEAGYNSDKLSTLLFDFISSYFTPSKRFHMYCMCRKWPKILPKLCRCRVQINKTREILKGK